MYVICLPVLWVIEHNVMQIGSLMFEGIWCKVETVVFPMVVAGESTV